MKLSKRNIVVTGKGYIWEYDFDNNITIRGSFNGVNRAPQKSIKFKFHSDVMQTHSTEMADKLLGFFDRNESYSEIIDYGHGIEKIYEVNVPSPFLREV